MDFKGQMAVMQCFTKEFRCLEVRIVNDESRQRIMFGDKIHDKKEKRMSIMDMIRSPRQGMKQNWTLAKFMLVGASGVLVTEVILTALGYLLGDSRLLIANAIAVEASIINNFLWNDRYTFSHVSGAKPGATHKLRRLGKYNTVSLVSFTINEVVFYILKYQFGIYYIFSSLIAIGVAFFINYIGSSRWAWRHHAELLEPGAKHMAQPSSQRTDAIK